MAFPIRPRLSCEFRYGFHLYVFPDCSHSSDCTSPRLHICRRRGNLDNLSQLNFVNLDRSVSTQPSLKMALVNAMSVCNKTYVLKNFFSSNELDILFLTETWPRLGESSVFEELSSSHFICTLRSVSKGGGVILFFLNT